MNFADTIWENKEVTIPVGNYIIECKATLTSITIQMFKLKKKDKEIITGTYEIDVFSPLCDTLVDARIEKCMRYIKKHSLPHYETMGINNIRF